MQFIYQKINAKILIWFLLAVFSASIFLLVGSVPFSRPAKATNCTWQSTGSTSWNTADNWSCASVPNANDEVAIFDNTSDVNCTIDVTPLTIGGFQMNSGYDGEVNLSSAAITMSASGGAWTYASGTLTPASSTVTFTNSTTITGTHALNNVTLNRSGSTFTIADNNTLTVAGTLTLWDGALNQTTIPATGSISATGATITEGGGFDAGTGKIIINGTIDQALSGNNGSLPAVEINKTTPGTTLSLSGTMQVKGNWTYTAGTINAGSSTITFRVSPTIAGSHTLGNVAFNVGTATIADNNTLTVAGTLTFSDGTLNQTTIPAAGSLAAQGDITAATGSWDGGTAKIVVSGSGTQTITGGGAATRMLALEINSSGTVVLSDSAVIGIKHNWTYTAGTVSASGSTVNPTAAITLDADGMSFGNLTISNAATTLGGDLDVDGTLTISTQVGAELDTSSSNNYSVTAGAVTMSNGIFDANASTISCEGNWSKTGGTFTRGTSTLKFTGTGSLLFDPGASTTYENVTLAQTAITDSVSLVNNSLTMDSSTTLSITTGILNLAGQSLNVGSGSATNIAATGILRMQGGETISNFTNSTAATSGTVSYIGTSTYASGLIAGDSYYNLIFNGVAGAWTLDANLDVNNNLTITNGTLDTKSDSNYQINVGHDWTAVNDGTNLGTFTSNGSKVVFDGSTAQTITTGGTGAGQDFQDVQITNTSAAVSLATNAIDIDGTLTINASAIFDIEGQSLTANILDNPGTLTLQGGETVAISSLDTAEGLVKYDGTSTYSSLAAGNTYYNLTFNGSGGVWDVATSILTVNGQLTLTNGTLDLTGQNLLATGAFTNDATLRLQGGETTTFTAGFDTNTGTVIYDGTSTYTGLPPGNTYNNLQFNGSGGKWDVTSSVLTVNGTLTLTNGTLDLNGQNLLATGAFTNNATLQLQGGETAVTFTVGFDTDTGTVIYDGTSTYTGLKLGNSYNNLEFSSSGTWTLNAGLTIAGGLTIGSSNTLDVNSQTLAVTGALDNNGDLKLQGGQTTFSYGSFDATGGEVIYEGTSTYTELKAGDSYYDLTFNASGTWNLDATLAVGHDLTITQGTLDLAGQNATVTGAFSNNGTLKLLGTETTVSITNDTNSGLVTYDGTGATGLKMGNNYYDLTFNGTSTPTWTLGAALDVNNDLTIAASNTLDASASDYDITVGENFANSGGFTAQEGTVTFDTAAKTSVVSGTNTFYVFKSITPSKIINFTAGTEQIISNNFLITGATGQLITLNSTTDAVGDCDPAKEWDINVTGSSTVSYVDVRYSNATGNPIVPSEAPAEAESVDSDCNTGWFNTAPFGGYEDEDILLASEINQSTTTDEEGWLVVDFKIKDAESNACTLQNFQYQIDSGTWTTPASAALSTDWDGTISNYTSAATFAAASEQSFDFKTRTIGDLRNTDSAATTLKVRFTVNDSVATSANPATSESITFDNLDPVVATAITIVSPSAGDTEASLSAVFTETNAINTSSAFQLKLNTETSYRTAQLGTQTVVGETVTTSLTTFNLNPDTLDGNDYFAALKVTLTDDYGNIGTSEYTTTTYVKPYTPPTPSVNNIQSSTLDLNIDKHSSEVNGLAYAIALSGTSSFVQANGSLAETADWNTMAEWGGTDAGGATVNVTGLSDADSAQFKVKSRNSADNLTESSYSNESALPGSHPRPSTPGAPVLANPAGSTSSINLSINTNVSGYADNTYCIKMVEGSTETYVSSSGEVFTATAGSCTYYSYSALGSGSGIVITGLSINTQYTFYIQAYNEYFYSSFSDPSSLYTLANPPGTPSLPLASVAATSLGLTLDTNSNPASTEFAIQETTTSQYVQSAGTLGTTAAWKTATLWGSTMTVSGLSVNTAYTFKVKAKNGDSTETDFSSTASKYTLANTPGAPSLPANLATTNSLGLTLDVNSNPANTEFAIQETTTSQYVQAGGTLGTTAAWQTSANWGATITIAGLSSNTDYTFKVKARNGDLTETNFSATASRTTEGPTQREEKQEAATAQEVANPTYAPTPAPSIGKPVASSTSIKWYFEESSINEHGFKLKDSKGNILKTSSTPNLSYLAESDLTPNTYYAGRKIVAFNTVGESESSREFPGVWTLAAQPSSVRIIPVKADYTAASQKASQAVKLYFDANGNPSYTKYLIREENTGRYLNQAGAIQFTAQWLTWTEWNQPAGLLIPDLEEGGSYSFSVQAKNEAGTTTDKSSPVIIASLDTTPPAAPIISYPTSGLTLETNLLTFSGTAEAKASVILYLAKESTPILEYPCPADEAGSFSCTLPEEEASTLASGEYTLKARTQDQSLNLSSYSPAISFILDLPEALEPAEERQPTEPLPTPEEILTELAEGLKEREINISLENSSFALEPSILRVGDTAALTVILKDKANNPLANHQLALTSSAGEDLIQGEGLTDEQGQTSFTVASEKAHTSLLSLYDQTEDYLLKTITIIFEPHVPGVLLAEASHYDLKPKGLLTFKDSSEITFSLYDEYYNPLLEDEYTLALSLNPALGRLDQDVLTIKNGQAQATYHAPPAEDIPDPITPVEIIGYLKELEIYGSVLLNLTRPQTPFEARSDYLRRELEDLTPDEGVYVKIKNNLPQAPNANKQMVVVADEPFTISFVPTGSVRKVSVFILNQEYQMQDLDRDGTYTYDYIISKAYKNQEVPMLILEERPNGRVAVSPASILVDPYGYVYELLTKSQIQHYAQESPSLANVLDKLEGQEIKIADATVVLFYQDPLGNEWVKWPAEDYGQHNPMLTNAKGEYAFMVPPGKYYVKVVKNDYDLYLSRRFEVEESKPVNLNIRLSPAALVSFQKLQTILNLIGLRTNLPDDVLIPLALLVLNLILGLPLIAWGYVRWRRGRSKVKPGLDKKK